MTWWFRRKQLLPGALTLLMAGCAASHRESPASPSKPLHEPSSQESISLAHDFFLRAERQEMAGNAVATLGYYQIAYSFHPESRDLCFLLLDHLRAAGKLDSAIALGKTCFALEGRPTAQEYQMLGEVYLRLDNADSAVKYYSEAGKLDEDDQEILFVQASLYEKLRDLPHYAETLRKLLPHLEYPKRLVEKLLQAYSALGQPDSAADFYRELLVQSPDDEKLLFSYGMLLQTTGKYQEATPTFEKLAKAYPDNQLILFEFGANLERIGRRDTALKIMRRIVEADSLNPVAMNYLGYMLVEDNQELDYAGRLIDRALELEPGNGAYLDSKGWWCYRKGDFAAAQVYLQKAAQQFPNDPTIREHLATVTKLLGKSSPSKK